MTTHTDRTATVDTDDGRAIEEELLIADVADTLETLLADLRLTQRELARRLSVTDGRVSQILSGTSNLRLNTVAAIGWALGVRFVLEPRPMANRMGTPAERDDALPTWVTPADIEDAWPRTEALGESFNDEFELETPIGPPPAHGGDNFTLAA